MRVLQPKIGKIDQGTIFCCAQADRYIAKNIYGLAITARCDVAQDKYPVLNYIPVVPLDDWLAVDGFEILHGRASAQSKANLSRAMAEAEIAESILNTLSPRQVLDEFFGANDKRAKSFEKFVSDFELLSNHTGDLETDVHTVGGHFAKLQRSLLRELLTHKLTGYYFLPRTSEHSEPTGWVLLLREVSYLPRTLSILIGNGCDQDRATTWRADWHRYLSFDHEPFAMPIGQIPSPEVEHILQSFSSLFGRIGLPDLDPVYVEDICSRASAKVES